MVVFNGLEIASHEVPNSQERRTDGVKAKELLPRFWPYFSVAAIAVILLGAIALVVNTLPPRRIAMATGAVGGANYEFGIRYRDILAKSGVELQLIPTSGGLQNLDLLNDPKSGVSVGFTQGGTITKQKSAGLESLGTVAYEPLWLFYRSDIGAGDIKSLSGRRVSVGPEGSGTRVLSLDLIERLKAASSFAELLGLPLQTASERLTAGTIDAATFVTSWESPIVQSLIVADGISLHSFDNADAYIALYPFLNKLVLPAGVGDLASNRPPKDAVLLAPKASLVVRADLHPAIQNLLLSAAEQIHSQPGIFQKAGDFPAAEAVDIPLSDEAQRFYKTGKPFLQQYLPFWIAVFVERMLTICIPLAALLYPVFSLFPGFYDWLMKSKISRLYDEMKAIEREVIARKRGDDVEAIDERLEQLDERANLLGVPTDYASNLYLLRSHIKFVRERLRHSPDAKLP
jgi:TRAP-type uncharacterized transport system substrate-binding protein